MLTIDDVIKTLQAQKDELINDYHLKRIGVFGSYAENKQSESSDIDFIIEFDGDNLDVFELKYKLRMYLQALFQKEVDLTRSKYLKPYVRDAILKTVKYAI